MYIHTHIDSRLGTLLHFMRQDDTEQLTNGRGILIICHQHFNSQTKYPKQAYEKKRESTMTMPIVT